MNRSIIIPVPVAASKRPTRSPTSRSQPSSRGSSTNVGSSRRMLAPPGSFAVTCAISPSVGRAHSSPTPSSTNTTAVGQAIAVYRVIP